MLAVVFTPSSEAVIFVLPPLIVIVLASMPSVAFDMSVLPPFIVIEVSDFIPSSVDDMVLFPLLMMMLPSAFNVFWWH